ncbi:hypothetical protein LAZ67_8001928 [Cordylochernes scorpioides]|uniref:Uncharacterized protein n=1 Tax=Cordylochernes scorpioides TaxID=51811 RepID=A0ABY6KQM8_9ARAC|nr:hypothetical protein LAZ67_8001928 [Cordylochernes scorpioides]
MKYKRCSSCIPGLLTGRAKDNLQNQAQKSTESCESYIQDVLSLCRQVNPDMTKEEKVAHLMKGVVEDVYQVILIKEIDTVEAFVDWCQKVEACKQRRPKDLIRRIVREEIKSALHSESIMPEVNSLKKIIHEEVERNLPQLRSRVHTTENNAANLKDRRNYPRITSSKILQG